MQIKSKCVVCEDVILLETGRDDYKGEELKRLLVEIEEMKISCSTCAAKIGDDRWKSNLN